MTTLRVFTNTSGKFGNPLGIIVDEENKISAEERQKIAAKSGFSEVVFINNLDEKNISIYSPKREIPFSGHAALGVAYFLGQKHKEPIPTLIGIKGSIETWEEHGFTWVRGELANAPPWKYEQLLNPSLVERLTIEQIAHKEHTFVWAWIDENKGVVRARTFAPDWGIPEDEANGSGSMRLASMLGRNIEVHHGKGSILYARPSNPGYAEVGGRVTI